MPARLKVRIIASRGLPVMDKSSDTSDAFVEVCKTVFRNNLSSLQFFEIDRIDQESIKNLFTKITLLYQFYNSI